MTDTLTTVADGLIDRLWTRVAAQDRLDALDEHGTGPTLCDRLAADPALLDAVVEDGVDELLRALASATRRSQLRTLRQGGEVAVDDDLLRAGLVQAFWTSDGVVVSPSGEVLSRLVDELRERVSAAMRARIASQTAG